MWTSHKDLICTHKRLAFYNIVVYLFVYILLVDALRIFVESDFFSRKYSFSFCHSKCFGTYIFYVLYSNNNKFYSSFFGSGQTADKVRANKISSWLFAWIYVSNITGGAGGRCYY